MVVFSFVSSVKGSAGSLLLAAEVEEPADKEEDAVMVAVDVSPNKTEEEER